MRLAGPALIVVLAACGAGNGSVTQIAVGDTRYQVPDAHIRSVASEPHRFMRIQPPESSFELIYDSRTSSRVDRFGWPTIFSLNDGPAPNISRYTRGDLKIVCRQAVNPLDGCGMRVQHRELEWTVLFPFDHSGQAHLIRDRALQALKAYES